MKKIFSLIPVLLFAVSAYAQWDFHVDTTIGKYTYKSTVDTALYETTFSVSKGNKVIFSEKGYDFVYSVSEEAVKKGGERYLFIEYYSGGAHCCTSLLIAKIKEGNFLDDEQFIKLDSAVYGNSGYVLEDLDSNGTKEIVSGNDMFAYAFTNYAETRFPLRVQAFNGKSLNDITGKYKKLLLSEIAEFKNDLDELVKGGFECPAEDGEDTFNTEAGSVKTLLAAIVADYYSLGEVNKGYELVDKVYKCVDRESYKKILINDFKLK
ncbi:MAG: hypothetical protein LWX07_07645 [Bacteroidetes bacterium]|nr:hypothetical protein [Bacteroidota bacterium]